jgi:hypothetical protein
MIIEISFEVIPYSFSAVILTVNVPDWVGLPFMIPVFLLIDNPLGSPVAVKRVGLFEATTL